MKIWVDGLPSPSVAVKRSAAMKICLLTKNRTDNRSLIAESGAIPVQRSVSTYYDSSSPGSGALASSSTAAKNIVSERSRRKMLNDRLFDIRYVVPTSPSFPCSAKWWPSPSPLILPILDQRQSSEFAGRKSCSETAVYFAGDWSLSPPCLFPSDLSIPPSLIRLAMTVAKFVFDFKDVFLLL